MKVGIIGAGGWGLALSTVLYNNQHEVTVWSPFEDEINELKITREHKVKLNGVKIPEGIYMTTNKTEVTKGAEILVIATPSSFVRTTLTSFSAYIDKETVIVNVAKGLEDKTLFTIDKIIKEVLPKNEVAILSGPSHAEEVGRKLPTSVVAASHKGEIVKLVQDTFCNDYFRVYGSEDVLGVELGGALKNVIALAAGVSYGLGYGDNTKAALMTRGIAEIGRLAVAMGAKESTLGGLSGIGDLIVTCTSVHSRNRKCGELIGKGYTLNKALDEIKMVVEGVYSAKAALELAHKYEVEMPIIEQVNSVLFENKSASDAVKELMVRNKKYERV